jgi:hypothetical protein
MKLSTTALSVCLILFHVNSAQAGDNWLTLVGDPKDPSADYIQLNPAGFLREKNSRTVPVRVSRAHTRTSKEGIVFRSFEGLAAVDCKNRTARIMQASFYSEPKFKGRPFRSEVFRPDDVRPLAFREISGKPAQAAIKLIAACVRPACAKALFDAKT